MAGLLFSIMISVSLMTAIVFSVRKHIIGRYGFRVLYILSFVLAVRLIIPYSVQLPNVPRLHLSIPLWIPIVWMIGAALALLYHTASYFYSRKRIMRYGHSCSNNSIKSLLQEEKSRLFIDRDIPLLLSKEVGTPMLMGVVRPVIVLPYAQYTESEYRMIFRHELLHYRNKDSIKKLFFIFVASVCWFNPFVYLLMRQSAGSLECICDANVLKNADNEYKKNYCMMLLKTGTAHGRFVPAASYLNTKELMKMRISAIFEKKNKRSGSMVIVSVILCVSLLSSMLCSCTVETPQDVIDEMERVESSVDNEKDAQEGNVTLELHPVSEVTATARQTIDEWNSRDGIFKFDNCRFIMPEASEFIEYTYEYNVGIESAQQKLDLIDALEEKYFGKDYFTEDEMLYLPADQSGAKDGERVEYTREQFLESDGEIMGLGAFTTGSPRGSLELLNGSIRVYMPYYEEQLDLLLESENVIELMESGRTVNCQDPESMSEIVKLTDGSEVMLADAVALVEQTMNSSEYVIDSNISYKGDYILISPQSEETNTVNVYLRAYYSGVPFVGLRITLKPEYMEKSEIDAKYCDIYEFSDFEMSRAGRFDFMLTTLTHTKFTPTGKSVSEIISVEQVLEILKDTFSNQTVYKVTEFALGNAFVSNEDEYSAKDFRNIPIYEISLEMTGRTLRVWIDARTGDMNYV